MDGNKNIIKIKRTDGNNELYIINYSKTKSNCKRILTYFFIKKIIISMKKKII